MDVFSEAAGMMDATVEAMGVILLAVIVIATLPMWIIPYLAWKLVIEPRL